MVGKYTIAKLPLAHEIETKEVLKKTLEASRALAELKILAKSIPNENILINTLSLQEAKYSSEIENIITTSDDLYKSNFDDAFFISKASKEVHNYAQALKIGKQELLKSNLLTNKLIKQIQQQIEGNNAGFRTQIGTTLKDQDGKIIYTPPQDIVEIETLMTNLEMFINQDEISDLDPLIKMAIIHHQFESIHPFFDGNGRTGRIINILYLIKNDLLQSPVLYLSRYINQNKQEYYNLLQNVRNRGDWSKWILFMLDAIYHTSLGTIETIISIKKLMREHKNIIRDKLPNIYSQELLNNLFSHPYTKIDFMTQSLQVHKNTATKYLNSLVDLSILDKLTIGRENYYINKELFDLLSDV